MFVPLVALFGLVALALVPLPDESGVAIGVGCVAVLVLMRLPAALRPTSRLLALGWGMSARRGRVHGRSGIARKD